MIYVPVGLYYLEKDASQRPSNVIYDREYSAIAKAKKEDFDWDRIFDGADWFYWTGLNPSSAISIIAVNSGGSKKLCSRI